MKLKAATSSFMEVTNRLLAQVGVDPAIMGSGPIGQPQALEKAGWSAEELDLVEANEAFAAQACAVNKDLVGCG